MERVKRFLCALLVAITMVTMVSAPLQVQAATASGNSDWKKAPTIRKRGTYTVTDKKKEGVLKFVAPKTGNYTLTFSNFRKYGKTSATKTSEALGNLCILKPVTEQNYTYLKMLTLQTNYGKSFSFNICTKYWYDLIYKYEKKDRTSNLYSRYVKIHLKKGQAIYIKAFWTGGKHQYTMKIKC